MGQNKRPNSVPVPLSKKQRRITNDITPNYIISDGLLKVEPYDYIYQTYAKQRWLGKSIIAIFEKEFHSNSPSYYKNAILSGRITVNGVVVSLDYILRNSDLIEHKTHRHEPPVCSIPIEIVHDGLDILVISKPGSFPVHATGRYRFNTVLEILKHKFGYDDLHPINRIDRLTSGLIMLAKNKTKAAEMVQSMRDRDIQKTYLARVKGKFPYDEYTCTEPIETVSHKVGVNVVSANGKPCITKFTFVKFNGTTSLVKCEPKTGRTHQIRVHLQWLGFPIANDPVYCNEAWKDYLFNNENVEQVVNNVTDIVFAAEATVDDDIGCIECRNNRKDPIPEQLFIWLHSLKYESDNWAYETKLPSWAHDGFDGDKDIQKRFWDHGGRWDGEAPGTIVSFNDT